MRFKGAQISLDDYSLIVAATRRTKNQDEVADGPIRDVLDFADLRALRNGYH